MTDEEFKKKSYYKIIKGFLKVWFAILQIIPLLIGIVTAVCAIISIAMMIYIMTYYCNYGDASLFTELEFVGVAIISIVISIVSLTHYRRRVKNDN